MAQPDLPTSQLLAAKTLAMEVALLALLREQRDNQPFWESLDKLMQVVLCLDHLGAHPNPDIAAMAESAQDFLDSWRSIAGTNPNGPAPPGAGPFLPGSG